MKRRLFLHVGAHRTGTTSIQSFMAQNFGMLQQKGVFHPFAVPRHVGLINKIFNGTKTVREICEDINARADSKPHTIHTVVLSDEDICTRPDLSALGELSEYFEVAVVLMMRRQDLWLESWYHQNIKWQWNEDLAHLPFDAFLTRRDDFFWIHYDRTVQAFESLFGAGRVICLPFETQQMPQGPVMAFCDAIGLSDFEMLKMPDALNRSLSPLMGEFMRTLPLGEIPGAFRRQIEQACMKADNHLRKQFDTSSRLLMGPAMRTRVMAEYSTGNSALAQQLFDRAELFMEPLPPADAPLALHRLPADSYETIEHIVVPVFSALMLQMMEQALTADAVEKAMDAP
jgi:hypothetical protein